MVKFVITNAGLNELKEINPEKISTSNRSSSYKYPTKIYTDKYPNYNTSRTNIIENKKNNFKTSPLYKSQSTGKILVKKIKVNTKVGQMQIPSFFKRMYVSENEEINDLNLFLGKKSTNLNSKINKSQDNCDECTSFNNYTNINNISVNNLLLPEIKPRINLKKIISEKCYNKLYTKLDNKVKDKKNEIRLDFRLFVRNNPNFNKMYKELDSSKNYKIEAENTSLIEYLMQKTHIGENILKQFKNIDHFKQIHYNKIANKILDNDKKEK